MCHLTFIFAVNSTDTNEFLKKCILPLIMYRICQSNFFFFFFACVYSKYSEIINFNLDDQLQWY